MTIDRTASGIGSILELKEHVLVKIHVSNHQGCKSKACCWIGGTLLGWEKERPKRGTHIRQWLSFHIGWNL
jgi:hypothetical protein